MGWRFLAAVPLMAICSWWICSGLIGRKELETSRLQSECTVYIQKALPRILRTWSFEEWKKRASGELLLSVNHKRQAKSLKTYKRIFGEVRRIGDPVGSVKVDDRGGMIEMIGTYTSAIRFERGNADIAMRLVKRKGGWKFQQFSVRSDMVPSED